MCSGGEGLRRGGARGSSAAVAVAVGMGFGGRGVGRRGIRDIVSILAAAGLLATPVN